MNYSEEILHLDTMNIELTTKCPLHCPQCYCSLEGGKNIDLSTAINWLKEGAKVGVKDVMLSGGETLCYPNIYDIIRTAKELRIKSNVALSGYNFNQDVLDKLVETGVNEIFISLNGSTNEINSLTRDGYNLAINALKLLKANNYQNTHINWVMHCNNADDFSNIISLAENYNVSEVVVMAVKPTSKKELKTIPTFEQMCTVRDFIRSYKGNVRIGIESCFSPMLALTCDTKLFGNFNVGPNSGCCAGLSTFSVSVDGKLSPCRHLEYYEEFNSLEDYWNNSSILKKIREIYDKEPSEPCKNCNLMNYCRPCMAVNSKLEGKLYRGNKYCPIGNQ